MKDEFYLIENEVRGEINKIITEASTVSDEVLKYSDTVEKYIQENIVKQPQKIIEDGYAVREMSFTLKLFETDLDVHFGVVNNNFLNNAYYNAYKKHHDINTNCTSVYRRFFKKPFVSVTLRYISVNFKPLAKFYEDLHHELNHIWQQHNVGDTYADAEKYVYISTDIYSKNEVNRDAARILYLANPSEQDSYISSIYAYIRHNFHYSMTNNKTIDELLKETEAYQNICEFKMLLNKISNDREKYGDVILNKHGFKRWDRFDKRMRNALHRYEEKFAMCTRKCKKDFLVFESHTWCEGPDYNDYYRLF